MADPRTDAVNAYLRMIGAAPRRRQRPAVIDDDEDVTIGAARVVPENDFGDADTAVEFGGAQVEDDDEMIGAPRGNVEMGEVTVERPVQSQGVRNVGAALPEFLSEPFGRVTRDPDSLIGGALRTAIDTDLSPVTPIIPGRHSSVTRMLPEWARSRLDAIPRTIGEAADTDTLEGMQSFGERGLDAIPLGFGEEIYTLNSAALDPDYTRPRQQERARGPGLGADDAPLVESNRDRYIRERSERSARNPASSAAGTFAGSLPAAALTPGPTSASVGGRILQAGRNNALVGGVLGAGLSEDDTLVGRAGDALEGAEWGAVGGVLGQTLGEGVGMVRRAWQAARAPTGPVLDTVREPVAASLRLTDGDDAARAAERMLARDNAPDLPPGTRAGQFNDDVTVQPAPTADDMRPRQARPWTDDPALVTERQDPRAIQRMMRDAEGTAPQARARRGGVIDDVTEPMALADEADVTMIDDSPLPDDVDEMIGEVVDRPRRGSPTMPEQGPELRAAAIRGQRARGPARGDRALDPSIQATDELTAMARDYADIEGGVGGFQSLKNARIRQAMQAEPPPAGWEDRSQQAIQAMAERLDAISRRAGAQGPIVSQVGRARFALDEAQTMLDAARTQGRPLDPSEMWRTLNQANMSVGRAAAQEARGFGSGVQHTSAFAEPLTQSYQQMRAYLADPEAWGVAAARVQREMNASTAPLLRTGRALRDRSGALFADSGEQAAQGGGFRTYEEARPEAVRGLMSRAGDDAYESERALLRAWVENYGEQGATLARIADDPALQAPARAMQSRAQRLLDILDQAEIDGRAASMLESIGSQRPFMRGPTVDQMVRLAHRIESGQITAPEMPRALQALQALEGATGISGAVSGMRGRIVDDVTTGMLTRPVRSVEEDEEADQPFVPPGVRRRDESMPTSTPQPMTPEDEEFERFNPFARRAPEVMR